MHWVENIIDAKGILRTSHVLTSQLNSLILVVYKNVLGIWKQSERSWNTFKNITSVSLRAMHVA